MNERMIQTYLKNSDRLVSIYLECIPSLQSPNTGYSGGMAYPRASKSTEWRRKKNRNNPIHLPWFEMFSLYIARSLHCL